MKIIYKTVVGSRMHNLHVEGVSDTDTRFITMPSFLEVLSPFRNKDIKVRNKNGQDEESWTISHFVSQLTHGNPTCYEVIKSHLYDKTMPLSESFRATFPLYHNSREILAAHMGYAAAQLNRYLNNFVNMAYKSEEGPAPITESLIKRLPKATVAAYRVLMQGTQLLTTGDFQPRVMDYSQSAHDFLMEIKLRPTQFILTDSEEPEIIMEKPEMRYWAEHGIEIEKRIQELSALYDTLPEAKQNLKPNLTAIEQWLENIYLMDTTELVGREFNDIGISS